MINWKALGIAVAIVLGFYTLALTLYLTVELFPEGLLGLLTAAMVTLAYAWAKEIYYD